MPLFPTEQKMFALHKGKKRPYKRSAAQKTATQRFLGKGRIIGVANNLRNLADNTYVRPSERRFLLDAVDTLERHIPAWDAVSKEMIEKAKEI